MWVDVRVTNNYFQFKCRISHSNNGGAAIEEVEVEQAWLMTIWNKCRVRQHRSQHRIYFSIHWCVTAGAHGDGLLVTAVSSYNKEGGKR